jgi:hypothetical protein
VRLSEAYCHADHADYAQSENYRRVEKVFVLSQAMGNSVFHFLIENLPRLALYHSALLADPSIKIHVNAGTTDSSDSIIKSVPSYALNYLAYLGIPSSRITAGNILAQVTW